MDVLLGKVTQQAINYAIRSGLAVTGGFAIKQCSRLLHSTPRGSRKDDLRSLQARLESKIRIISPAIDMIELIAARGNTSLESAVQLTKDIRWEIQALGVRLSNAANDEELFRRGSQRAKPREQIALELELVTADMRSLLIRIEDAVPLINLAITTSGVNLTTNLPGTVSPSRLLQASTLLTAADARYAEACDPRVQVGPTYVLSMYMLFAGHAWRPQDDEDIRPTTWKEVIHKARVKLARVPITQLEQLETSRTGRKRNHDEFSATTPTAGLWQHTRAQDTTSAGHIDSTLEKWFSKTHAVDSASQARPRLNAAAHPSSSASTILSSALADRAHLLKRARTPRSCAPYQLARQSKAPRQAVGDREAGTSTGDATVYDDADMYAVLLTTLLEQRGSATVTVDGSAAISGHAVRREAKTRRVVDTKASKGRKLRYTTHEKLLNYMAPREVGNWGDRQVDELFSSLFGRRVDMGEDREEAEDDDGAMDVGMGEKGLLFGR